MPSRYRVRRARFQPKRIDTLRPEMQDAIGREIAVIYGWTMGDGDQYPGQIAYVEARGSDVLKGYWVPAEDLSWSD